MSRETVSLSTGQVAKRLNIRLDKLQNAIYRGKLDPPDNKLQNHYIWNYDDIERAEEYFADMDGGGGSPNE